MSGILQTPLQQHSEGVADWYTANQRYLVAALAVVRTHLAHHAATTQDAGATLPDMDVAGAQHVLAGHASSLTAPSALETLCLNFGLSAFERDLLLLCAGMELDAAFVALCAAAHGDSQRTVPTLSLALAVLPGAHWSALTPDAPLRRWRLIELGASSTLMFSPLRIDERVLHYLWGMQYLDERLVGLVDRITNTSELVSSQTALVERMVRLWTQHTAATMPVVQLCGTDGPGKRAVASAACAKLDLGLCYMDVAVLPTDPRELDAVMRLWEREATLSRSALLLDCDEHESSDATRERAVTRFIEGVGGVLIVTGRNRRHIRVRPIASLDVAKPTRAEQRAVWQTALGPAAPGLNSHVEQLAAQFSLSLPAIYAATTEIRVEAADNGAVPTNVQLGHRLWEACRAQARPRLDDLAQPILSQADWEDLVLPDVQRQTLHEIAANVRQRVTVYEKWGFTAKSARGLGISVLFAGPSGTGKTLAAEVLANDLRLDLYCIDLSQVVSKYIGETEKNLRRVFDAADEGGAVLLFDEADALFGKRSEVKDSHDRYANIEVSYLLQRMESYRGLAILTSNLKNALDTAFLRRIRFIVNFPFPDAAQRAEIWRCIFPLATPTEGLDVSKLARLNVAGGNIHNIALNSAFIAAEAGEPVRMVHLLRAAQIEYAKLEKPLTESEVGGWG